MLKLNQQHIEIENSEHRKGRNLSEKILGLSSSVFEEKHLYWKDWSWFPKAGAPWVLDSFRQPQLCPVALNEEGGCTPCSLKTL